ncbi:MAG: hypothetical protein CMF74_02290 [Maricaulis sp.]|mgnify:CR=1 FL=1|jgi:uncharacterized membrane protein|nr:hypothetical protein [Maricaulis sp.]HAQ33778.1 hypothetical protein [Alphaproteobacteria bacterium]
MRLVLLLVLIALHSPSAFGQSADHLQTVRVCPVEAGETAPPDFAGERCELTRLDLVDPQGTALWVELNLSVAYEMIASGNPLGLYLSGKMTAAAWVNGTRIGSNGQPGVTRAEERPGNIDAVLFLPRESVTAGDNRLVLQMSAHRGLVQLRNPVQWIAVAPFGDPTRFLLSAYWPALITLGIFIIGFASFGILALRNEDRPASALLALMSLLAAVQLVTETLRGIWSYPYHWQDWRLIGLVALAGLFGTALSALMALKAARLRPALQAGYVAGVGALTALAVISASAFDFKTALAILVPAAAGMVLAGYGIWQRHRPSPFWLAALAAFLIAFRLSEGWFLDRYFFFLIAAFLCVLFVIQAVSYARERRIRRSEESRARKLEAALDLARERAAPSDIAITAPGRMEKLSTARITHLKGAGDYVEIQTDDARTLLHSGSLAALEDALPATFLRVHRSYIVNTAFVEALEREATGTGLLSLTNGVEIPVSRRILPVVRLALAGNARAAP